MPVTVLEIPTGSNVIILEGDISMEYLDTWTQADWDKFGQNLSEIFGVEFTPTTYEPPKITIDSIQTPWNKNKKGLQVAWNKGLKTDGHPHTIESKNKIAIALKGKKKSESHILNSSDDYIVTKPNGETIHVKNLNKFAKDNNLDQGALSKVVSGKRAHHKGWVCRRINQQ